MSSEQVLDYLDAYVRYHRAVSEFNEMVKLNQKHVTYLREITMGEKVARVPYKKACGVSDLERKAEAVVRAREDAQGLYRDLSIDQRCGLLPIEPNFG